MADIRCPMCGKDNPEDREVCQYCDARLKPLIIDSPDEDYGSDEMQQALDSSGEEDQETPDWLKSLRDQDEEPPADQSADLPEAEWLIPARETRRLNTGEIEMEDLGDESWLDSFRSDEVTQDESGDEAAEITDGSEEGEPQEFQEEIPEDHLDDWLATGDFATRTLDSEEESEFLLEDEEQESDPEAPPAEEEPEWLSRVRSRAREDMPAEESLDDITSEGEEFLRSLGDQDAGQTLGLNFESGEADSDTVPQQDADLEKQPSGDSSSWLSKFGIDENNQEEVQEQEKPVEGVEVPPVEAFDISFDEETEISAEDEEDLSWLSELEQQASPGEQESTPESESLGIEAQDAEYPEWLSGLAEGGLDVEADVEPLEGDTEAEKPDWLMPTTEKGEAEEGIGVFDLEAEEEQSFDWLADGSEEEFPPSGTPPSFEPGMEGGAPEGAVGPFEVEEADWSLEEVEESQDREDSESVVPAELPNWLEAMRPVEAAAVVSPPPEESTREPESSGPLAGLHGIIPAGPSFSPAGEPSVYSVKLQVSETQLAYAKSLEAMIESEGVPERAQKKTGLTSQHILRIIVFVVLIAAVSWPIFTASYQSPLPVSYPGTSDAQRVIGGLGESPSVMVAVDYQPANSGEMETSAEPVIDHLMIKGAYFTMVSTHAGGAVQAERLLRLVNERHNHFYESIDHYAVLGFIPGGTAGLAAFSQSARQAVPYALNNTDAGSVWDRPSLQTLSKPDDFDLLIVITENAETARAWVEQVGSELSDTPMLMVASAQAAPMIMPYYESNAKQLDGIVIGLPGAGAYESSLPRQNAIRNYWDAFGFGISAAILIVLAGGVYNLVMEVIARQRQSKEAG